MLNGYAGRRAIQPLLCNLYGVCRDDFAHWTEEYVGFTTSLGALERRKISCPWQESNRSSLVMWLIACYADWAVAASDAAGVNDKKLIYCLFSYVTCCVLDDGCSIIERMKHFSSCRDLSTRSRVYSPSCRLGVIIEWSDWLDFAFYFIVLKCSIHYAI